MKRENRILITGGAGFIGSNFIRYFINKYPDYFIINFDKLTYAGNLNNLKDIKSKNYKFIKGDIAKKADIEPIIKESDYIINFAAESHVDRSIKSSKEFMQTNIIGVELMLSLAKKYNTKKFLQISTDEVYGSIKKGSFTEQSILSPSSPYSSSKASGDLIVISYYKTFNLPVLITRSSNNYGPYQFPEKVIPLFITNAIKDKKLPIYSKGENVRNWIYVIDNCKGIDTVFHKGKIGEIYNIAGVDEITNIELSYKILKILKKDKSLIRHVSDRLGHDFRYSINFSKTKQIGFKQETRIDKGLLMTVDWYKNNPWWWQPLIVKK